ncbi:hypothetical protein [Halorussus halophilus]|uniref:hypothetical protein n=1 Tax=Halorussus halophilus TaxID=2650975 RepID=UPI00130115F9|nr:hypothetical protein [Halorussus halophilus]
MSRTVFGVLVTKRAVILGLVAVAAVLGAGVGFVFPLLSDSPAATDASGATTQTTAPATTADASGGTGETDTSGPDSSTIAESGDSTTTDATDSTTANPNSNGPPWDDGKKSSDENSNGEKESGGQSDDNDQNAPRDDPDDEDGRSGDPPDKSPSSGPPTVGVHAESNASVSSLSSVPPVLSAEE